MSDRFRRVEESTKGELDERERWFLRIRDIDTKKMHPNSRMFEACYN